MVKTDLINDELIDRIADIFIYQQRKGYFKNWSFETFFYAVLAMPCVKSCPLVGSIELLKGGDKMK